MQNPYTLTFGKSPTLNISRPEQVNHILDAFTAENINEPIFMITGIRGCGKTVMMTEIAKRLEQYPDWIIIDLNPTTDMLESLLSKLYSNRICNSIIKEAKIDLSFWGLGIQISAAPKLSDKETAIIQILENLRKHKKRILILIDEAINNEYMRTFASTFQIFSRKDLPVCLLMTGLYENIDNLQNEKNLTFLYRAPKITPKPLGKTAMARKYKESLKISEQDALTMANLTNGYSFAFQVLGYLTWNKNGDYRAILSEYEEYLSDYVYDKLWSELSPKDKTVILGIAKCESPRIKDIREYLHMETNEFNPYRKRLIKKGILSGNERGFVKFEIPLFKEYALNQFMDL